MKTKINTIAIVIAMLTGIMSIYAFKQYTKPKIKDSHYKVIFYELGSVKCIPCQKMQPVMKSVEEKYGDQVQVIFYDVWTKEGKEAAKKFDFDLIPTQIFTDLNGKELFRHEGYFPEEELVKELYKLGVK